MEKLDAIVYIGRFQPFTNAHYKIVKKALGLAEKVLIFVGSSKVARSTRNPWTELERTDMILNIDEFLGKNIFFIQQVNSNYNTEGWWVKDVQSNVCKLTKPNNKIGIIGFKKDSSSYYLDLFPQWEFIPVAEFEHGLSATTIREYIFSTQYDSTKSIDGVPKDVELWIKNWLSNNKDIYSNLRDEFKFIKDYKEQWNKAPYPPIFVTTDAVVICKGHILLIKRKSNPGKDLYAMPGGFLNQTEYLKDCCIRELKEETRIDISRLFLKGSIVAEKYFDDPYREARGRGITHCFLFNLKVKELPKVKGSDDAYSAKWILLGDLDSMQDQFFGDHYQIIKNMLGQIK